MAAGNLVQGALFTVMVVRAAMLRDSEFEHELAQQIGRSPRFFQNAPVVLDLRGVENFTDAAEFAKVRDNLQALTLTVVGVQNAQPAQLEAASKAGLASFAPNASTQPRAVRARRAAGGSEDAARHRASALGDPDLRARQRPYRHGRGQSGR